MSLIHKFYAGNTDAIVAALKTQGYDKLDDRQIVFAKSEWGTFFLDWADALIQVLRENYGLEMKNFEATWERYIFNGPEDESFAVKINNKFSNKLADFSDDDLLDISKKWSALLKKGIKQIYDTKDYRRHIYFSGIGILMVVLIVLFLGWSSLDFLSAAILTVVLGLGSIGRFFCFKSRLSPAFYNFSYQDLHERLKEMQNLCRVAIDRKTDVLYSFSL